MRCGKDSWVVVGILVVLVTVAAVFLYRSQEKELDLLKTRLKAAKSLLEVQSQKASIVPDLTRQIGAMKKQYKDFDRRLPQSKEIGEFLRELSAHLGEEKLSDESFNPGSPQRRELFQTQPITMKFKGAYLSTVDFLRRIDRMKRLTRVQKLKIKRISGQKDLDIEVQLNIYFTES